MIDVDQLEERLDRALEEDLRHHLGLDDPPPAARWTAPSPPAPSPVVVAPTPAPPPPPQSRPRRRRGPHPAARSFPTEVSASPAAGDVDGHGRRVVELVRLGRIQEADAEIEAHARLVERAGARILRRDAAAWSAMRALLDGREHDARVGSDAVLSLGESAGDPNATAVHWAQRFWILQEWGSERENDALLDFCRQRAYWHDEIEWRATLALLLARLDYLEEAGREFDFVAMSATERVTDDAWLDVATNLAETAAALADPARARIAYDALAPSAGQIAVVGTALVCKGSTSHQLGLLATTLGRQADADKHFGVAMETHRSLGGGRLLARTQAAADRLRSAGRGFVAA